MTALEVTSLNIYLAANPALSYLSVMFTEYKGDSMKKVYFGLVPLVVLLSTLFLAVPGASAMTSGFSCGATVGLIVNVTEKVKNDADSGTSGDTWALDTYKRTIKIWNMGLNNYCAVVTYDGKFQALAGHISPQQTGTLTGEEEGSMKGGYQTVVFSGTLSVSDPKHWPLKGEVKNTNGGDVIDYQCATTPNPLCPGYIDYFSRYFSNVVGSNINLQEWGWIYRAENHHDGVWVNALDGNSGDILDNDTHSD